MNMAANTQHMVEEPETTHQKRPKVQLNQFLLSSILAQQNLEPYTGWQAGVANQERMIKCHNLITNMGLSEPNIDFVKITEIGVDFERNAFDKSRDKREYEDQMWKKTNEFFRRREAAGNDFSKIKAQVMQTEYAQILQPHLERHPDSRWKIFPREYGMNPEARAAEVQKDLQTGRPQQQQQVQVQALLRQPAKPRDIKWSTISKDSTKGAQARDAELLREFGKRFRNSSTGIES